MYVCICNAIRESDLRAAALCCSGDADEVYMSLGRTPQCRQCIDDAHVILRDERTAAASRGVRPTNANQYQQVYLDSLN